MVGCTGASVKSFLGAAGSGWAGTSGRLSSGRLSSCARVTTCSSPAAGARAGTLAPCTGVRGATGCRSAPHGHPARAEAPARGVIALPAARTHSLAVRGLLPVVLERLARATCGQGSMRHPARSGKLSRQPHHQRDVAVAIVRAIARVAGGPG